MVIKKGKRSKKVVKKRSKIVKKQKKSLKKGGGKRRIRSKSPKGTGKMPRFGLGFSAIMRETPEEKQDKLESRIKEAQRKLSGIFEDDFKYNYIDVENPEVFITRCESPYISIDKDGSILFRHVIIVDLEKIPLRLKGDFDSLTYTNQLGELITKQAFYSSSGVNSSMKNMWLPFDGVSYHRGEDGILNTRFEKDNFDGRFGGMVNSDDYNNEKKLSLVSQILGGPLWDVKDRISEILTTRRKELEKLIRDVVNIVARDDTRESNRISDILDNIDNIWEDNMIHIRERIPNILLWDNGVDIVYHNPKNLYLSNGIDIPRVPIDLVVSDGIRLRSASDINRCIIDNNSLKIDFSAFPDGVPNWEQLHGVLSGRVRDGKYLDLYKKIGQRLVR